MITIEEIKAQCRLAIELSENATPGPWDSGKNDDRSSVITGIEFWAKVNTPNIWYSQCKDDAEFIAKSRSICPAAARATLAMINEFEEWPDVIQLIRTAWEGRK